MSFEHDYQRTVSVALSFDGGEGFLHSYKVRLEMALQLASSWFIVRLNGVE